MSEGIRDADIVRFRDALSCCLGLQFNDAKSGFLAEVLRRRLDQRGEPIETYIRRLGAADPTECAALARDLTVGETYFFRNSQQFHALADTALPDRLRTNAATRTLRLLSAGCASGEEAYSLAIALHETAGLSGWNVSIRAVDLNPSALEKARRACYSSWALRETPAESRQRWFRAAGRDFLLDPGIRAAVRFDERNLAVDDAELWRPGSFDVVFCRNVIMYFTPEQARALVGRIARALQPGGYLFLGHAETLRGLSDDFHLRHTHGTFYYERRESTWRVSAPPAARLLADSPQTAPSDAWIDVIREASVRVATLAAGSAQPRESRARTPPPDLVDVLDLLRREQFADALDLLRSLSQGDIEDPDTLLLEATLLANCHLLQAAEMACTRLLAIDELNAGAHYVLALCRERAGDFAAAAEHDRVAAYLDPGFAMPRLHLGLLARRAGERAVARRELASAFELLKQEDASRLLLFGGGFNRGSLLALCESSLRDCGGAV